MTEAANFVVATFNIQHGSGGNYNDPGNPDLVAEGCLELEADIIGMQEVDVGVPRSQKANLAEIAAKATGMTHEFAEAGTFRGRGKVGNALLVKGEILDKQVVELKGDRHTVEPFGHRIKLVRIPRNILIARVIVFDHEMKVGVTHMGGDNRYRMLGQAAAALVAWPGPHILLGDFNQNWAESNACLEPYGLNVLKDELRSPDHIAINGLQAISISKHYSSRRVSDHTPVKAQLVA